MSILIMLGNISVIVFLSAGVFVVVTMAVQSSHKIAIPVGITAMLFMGGVMSSVVFPDLFTDLSERERDIAIGTLLLIGCFMSSIFFDRFLSSKKRTHL